MKILFPVDEAYPLYKIGGLGDVGGSLPKAFSDLGIDVRIALPFHPEIDVPEDAKVTDEFSIIYDKESLQIRVLLTQLADSSVPVYLFEEKKYISQHTDASDNHADKFAVFCLAVSEWLVKPNPTFIPHLIHLHDWHSALIPVILKATHPNHGFKTAINIHNLAYQGRTTTPVLSKMGIAESKKSILNWQSSETETNLLLEGILHSDMVIAVSPTYADEILTEEYGEGVETQLQAKKDSIVGIINGIDTTVFNPEEDPHIFQQFSIETFESGKKQNKLKLLESLGLESKQDIPLIGFVGRVDPGQKGIQLIIDAFQKKLLPINNTQFVFLGTGDPDLEKQLHEAAADIDNVVIVTRYDEPLAAQIYAASDVMIIPSKYEPCGLVQMIAMRYGALPIARATGGLKDTIVHDQDGFLFSEYETVPFINSIHYALEVISHEEKKKQMIVSAMSKNFTWDEPAKVYSDLFTKMILEK